MESATRKIIFWYDAPVNFKEDIASASFDFCCLLVCQNNEFAIKKTIEKDDITSNILVYIPYEKPKDRENWLLDILTYSEEYYADTVALTMRHLGLSNPDLCKVIEKHTSRFIVDILEEDKAQKFEDDIKRLYTGSMADIPDYNITVAEMTDKWLERVKHDFSVAYYERSLGTVACNYEHC